MLHSAYSVRLGATVLAGLTNLSTNGNPEVDASVGIGSQFPQFAVVRSVRPQIAFQSRAIAAALAITGTTGAAIDADDLVASYIEMQDGSPGSATLDYTIDRGLLLPRRLQCSHRQDAVLDVEALTHSVDGDTDPITIGAGAPATIARDNIRHTLKSVIIAGVEFDCLTDVTIDFGVNAETLGCNSHVYDTLITKDNGVTPTVNITTLDVGKVASLGLKGSAAAHADTTIVLRQYATDGIGFASGADANDLTITASGVAHLQQQTGQGQQTSSATIQLTCNWDGTNAPLIIGS
ncbi:MAG: hypothetical protein AAGC97_03575 [Planctomycetota bacterium]